MPPDASPPHIPIRPLEDLPQPGALKGRGTAWAIEHRFKRQASEDWDDGWGTLEQAAHEEHLPPATQIIEENVKSILSRNNSPDIVFDLSVNPYRGCEHGCIYCFARPTHSYLNLSPGLDFETGITRAVLEVMAECRHPFSLFTKSSGIERDLDLIAPMAAQRLAAVYVSVTSLDSGLSRILEPRAAAPRRRLQTIEALAKAGVPVGVSVSPIIPFINEPELERVLEAAANAGAKCAFSVVLRLPWEVNPLFQQWLDQHFPERAARVMARVREMRGGRDYDASFGSRMRGEGVWAQLLRQRFQKAAARLGLNRERMELDLTQFRKPHLPAADGQGDLFG